MQGRTREDITAGEIAAGSPAAKWMLTFTRLLTQAGLWQKAGKVRELAQPAFVPPLHLEARPGAIAAHYPWAEFAEQGTSGGHLLGIGGDGDIS